MIPARMDSRQNARKIAAAGRAEQAMDFGIFNLMGARDPGRSAADVFAEVAAHTRLADELGYKIAWFAEHHFSNYCLCASPLMMVAHCAPLTKTIRLGTAVVVVPLYNPVRLLAEIAMADALSNGRLELGVGAGYQPYEFERFGVDLARNLEMTDEFCDILDLAFSRDFFRFEGRHYTIPETHIPARPVQKSLPVWLAGHSEHVFRMAARRGYRALSSGRTGSAAAMAEQRQVAEEAYRAEGKPYAAARFAINRFCCITDDRDEAMRFAENARYQARLASHLRRREEAMEGTMLVDKPVAGEATLDEVRDNLLIGNADEVARKLAAEIRILEPAHLCLSLKVGNTPHATAMRTTERFMAEVKPRLERELGPLDRIGAAAAAHG
jgi:alkanesulfonate monooxygenase SsuD/methylene tetrahydromethanopterin reductase-like flavin-dependent oxidoreductase (luciferase family)